MQLMLHYYVLKTYKGLFKKRHVGNTHILYLPISTREFLTLIILGAKDETTWIGAQVARAPLEYLLPMIDEMKRDLGEDAYVNIETLSIKPKEARKGSYKITLAQKGVYIKSNFTVDFEPEFSAGGRNLYSLQGNLDFYTSELNMKAAKMQAAKAVAKFSTITKRG